MWWDTHMIMKSLLKKEVDLIIDSDALARARGPEVHACMVPGREKNAYKPPGAASCNTCSQDIPEEQNQDVGTPQVRQHHSSGTYMYILVECYTLWVSGRGKAGYICV